MWPFKKKKQDKNKRIHTRERVTETLVMVRYTYEVWEKLFPELSQEDWEKTNYPNDVEGFVRHSVTHNTTIGNCNFTNGLIATLDHHYVEWLCIQGIGHSQDTLTTYIKERIHDDAFWNERLKDSEMTTTYNVMAIPISALLHNLDGLSTQYLISKEKSEELTEYLKKIYSSDLIYLPGWIMKGSDMPYCVKNIIEFADLYWEKGSRVRYGKYMEQNYTKEELGDLFYPFSFVIPFVVKTNITKAKIHFKNTDYTKDDCSIQAMTAIPFTKMQKAEMMEMLMNDCPYIVSMGDNAIMTGHAYSTHIKFMRRRQENCNKTH